MVGGRRRWHWWAAGLLLPAVAQAQEAAPAASHADPVTAVLATVVVMVAAKLGGAVFLRLRQPAVH